VHAERRATGRTDWAAIADFYDVLVPLAPTLGARIGQAVAVAEARGPETGLALLDEIERGDVTSYQPYWAVRAHLLQRLGLRAEASKAFDLAIGLTEDEAVRRFLLERRR
jgi:RNA polymerase sigma-70 factor (ECF subfamily)